MYEVHIEFSDGSPPFYKNYDNRQDYNEGMRLFQERYSLTMDRSVDSRDGKGNRFIFYRADRRFVEKQVQRMEVAKSRARYYSRTDGRTREGRRKRRGAEG